MIGASAAAGKTYLQSRSIKQLKGNRIDSKIASLMRTLVRGLLETGETMSRRFPAGHESTTGQERSTHQSTAIAIREPSSLSREANRADQRHGRQGATDEELRHFVAVCDRLGLDPFAKQITWSSDGTRSSTARGPASVDRRLPRGRRAEGQYRGQTAPQWCGYEASGWTCG